MDELIEKFKQLEMEASTEDETKVYKKVIKIIRKKCCQPSVNPYFTHHYLIVCEKCGGNMYVKDSREQADGTISRTRQCIRCNNKVYTIESELDEAKKELREKVYYRKISELNVLLKKIEMKNNTAKKIIAQLQGQQIKE